MPDSNKTASAKPGAIQFDNMRKIGFRNVDMLLYWSAEYGYYGVEQMLITAEK
jgi:hypothetical protein